MNIRDEKEYWLMRAKWAYDIYELAMLGSQVPINKPLLSRMRTPLLDDYVLEISTFHSELLKKGSLKGVGILHRRLYDINATKQPPDQDYSEYLWQIHTCPFDKDNPHENWSNARFIVLADFDWRQRFEKYGTDNPCMFPEYCYDCYNEDTWWWVKKAEQERRMFMSIAEKDIYAKK